MGICTVSAGTHWLRFLGMRRPTSAADQSEYDEQVSRPKAEPVAHELPQHELGERLGRGAHRTTGGRHRAD